jgi:hypothetical protein
MEKQQIVMVEQIKLTPHDLNGQSSRTSLMNTCWIRLSLAEYRYMAITMKSSACLASIFPSELLANKHLPLILTSIECKGKIHRTALIRVT